MSTSSAEEVTAVIGKMELNQPLTFVIFGATGDLARKKLYPAMGALQKNGLLPVKFQVIGVGRRDQDIKSFFDKQAVNVKGSEEDKQKLFQNCSYSKVSASEDWKSLNEKMVRFEGDGHGNRVFFLSVPPSAFGDTCGNIKAHCESKTGYTHVVIEKPFGHDSASFAALNDVTSKIFDESQLFRIDHYMGKEVVLNLLTLRFANPIFEPCWNKNYIESIHITMKEDLNTTGRGAYFDTIGIIRDIMQNHLLQVLLFLTIDEPASLAAEDIAKEKVKLLQAMEVVTLDDVFLGQFTKNKFRKKGKEIIEPGYLDDEGVPKDSKCPTFAQVCLKVNNDRWSGVPLVFTAGKGLDERMAEVRVRFKPKKNSIMGAVAQNEMVMRIQPHESIYMKTITKQPGLEYKAVMTPLSMSYEGEFVNDAASDAYERMLLFAARGDNSLFVGSDELVEAWRVFTPVLHQIDAGDMVPTTYPFGAAHPAGSIEFMAKYGIILEPSWMEFLALHQADVEKMKEIFEDLAECSTETAECTIDEHGVRKLVKRFYDGFEPTPERMEQVMSNLDENKNGNISWDEFRKAASNLYEEYDLRASQLDHT